MAQARDQAEFSPCIQAREKDRANYTCVAENVANRRLSPPARLNIHGKTLIFFFYSSFKFGYLPDSIKFCCDQKLQLNILL